MTDLIDLHTHSTASDGTYSPEDLVTLASQLGLRALAITDHDTISGIKEGVLQGRELGIEVVPGIELSIDHDGSEKSEMHILGLFVDTEDTTLLKTIDWLKKKRTERLPRMLRELEKCDIHVSEEEVMDLSFHGITSRPHIAMVMKEKGYVDSIGQAFDEYLEKGASAYIEKERLPLEKALGIILSAGGIPILAHPHSLNISLRELADLIPELKDSGLQGIEVFYTMHTAKETNDYLDMAKRFGLLLSGGSDFHGSNKPGINLGTGHGNLRIPYSLLESMKKDR